MKTGVTSWAEPSLLGAGFYPPGARSPAARLRFYATQFSLVENDAAYYAIPELHTVERWCERTPPGFTMNMKAFALLTGHYTVPRRLPRDLYEALPPRLRERPHVYPRDLGSELVGEVERRFYRALGPLADCGRLGVVLFQFPVWFPATDENRATLVGLRQSFSPYRIAVEFRNASWLSRAHADETLGLLAETGITYTCVDEPQGFPSSVPPIAVATTDLGLVRLHGRNAARWDRAARSAAERFDYRYSVEELRPWVHKARALGRVCSEVHVLFNNCHADHAVTNARQMQQLLLEAEALEPEGSQPSVGA
jgi:uncharacterized protein YecE (DUF72 family)